MQVFNRHKMQVDVAMGKDVYQTVVEILLRGDTLDDLDKQIIQKLIIRQNTASNNQDKELEKKVFDLTENAVNDILKELNLNK